MTPTAADSATGSGRHAAPDIGDVVAGFRAENERERALAEDGALLRGLAWGMPRPGHPEGSVGAHVADLLARIDARGEAEPRRCELRFITLVHDAFKHDVRERLPKTGWNHHAARARRFAERYTSDERLLATIELHDRPYAIWRRMKRTGKLDERAVRRMLARIPDLALFTTFVELDGSTEGKQPEPVRWFRDLTAAQSRPRQGTELVAAEPARVRGRRA